MKLQLIVLGGNYEVKVFIFFHIIIIRFKMAHLGSTFNFCPLLPIFLRIKLWKSAIFLKRSFLVPFC